MLWSIGCMDRHGHGAVDEYVRVIADAPNAPITGVLNAGDDLCFMIALNSMYDAMGMCDEVTPLSLAVELNGREGTVHEVLPDGSLRGWRRDYGDLSVPDLLLS